MEMDIYLYFFLFSIFVPKGNLYLSLVTQHKHYFMEGNAEMILLNIVIILPCSPLTSRVYANGFSITQLVDKANQTSIGSFAWLDVVVSVIIPIEFVLHVDKKEKIKYL